MLRRILCSGSTVIGIAFLLFVVLIIGSHSSGAAAAGSISLRPPFAGTYRLTSFFDHYYPNYTADPDGRITIYTGENVANCSPHCYRGHNGYDWSMVTGTQVLAAADGTVESRVQSDSGYGNRVVIRHDNGYRTLYAHFREHRPDQGSPAFNVVEGQRVRAGDVIGWSGNTGDSTGPHLHFGVYRGTFHSNNVTDPFGWRGTQPDPLRNFPNVGQGHTASCLWRSRDEDPISCADTIVEDAGQGSTISGAWNVSPMGNGYHMYYRYTTTDNNIYATWTSTSTIGGPHQVYAYIPSQNATTRNATYWIWTVDGWRDFRIDQLVYSDEWVLMGTYTLPANYAYVWMYANTGESPARWIAADAIKFRQYRINLPLVLSNYCSPSYGQLIVNGDFSTGDATGWTVSRSNGPAPIVQPYGGSDYGAWMGRYNSNQDQMYQVVCPATPADWANFSFYWWMTTEETSTTADYDFLYVRVRDASGNLLQTLKTITNRSPRETWHYEYFDLRAYTGQTIRISFEATNNVILPTHFWIDNVSFVVYDW